MPSGIRLVTTWKCWQVDSAKEVIIVPMKQIKYLACDATVFASKGPPQPKG